VPADLAINSLWRSVSHHFRLDLPAYYNGLSNHCLIPSVRRRLGG
jgi:hypothetical protein